MHEVLWGAAATVLAQADGQEAAKSGQSLLEYIRSGGTIGYVLILLSVVALGLAILHLIQVRIEKLAPPPIVSDLSRMLRENDIQGAIKLCRQEAAACFVTRVLGGALTRCTRSPFGLLELRTAIEDASSREIDKLYRTTDGIGLIAAVAPMLGLLGTVFGMIGAFGSISGLEGAARSKELAGFMSLALVTTAMGLALAIPATAAFSLFRRRIEHVTHDVGEVMEQLAGLVEQRSGGGQAARGPARQAPRPEVRAAEAS